MTGSLTPLTSLATTATGNGYPEQVCVNNAFSGVDALKKTGRRLRRPVLKSNGGEDGIRTRDHRIDSPVR